MSIIRGGGGGDQRLAILHPPLPPPFLLSSFLFLLLHSLTLFLFFPSRTESFPASPPQPRPPYWKHLEEEVDRPVERGCRRRRRRRRRRHHHQQQQRPQQLQRVRSLNPDLCPPPPPPPPPPPYYRLPALRPMSWDRPSSSNSETVGDQVSPKSSGNCAVDSYPTVRLPPLSALARISVRL